MVSSMPVRAVKDPRKFLSLTPRLGKRAKLTRTPPEHWRNLPRRKCDACGKMYKPTQPFKKNQKYGFCQRSCKDNFHFHGGAYSKLKDLSIKEIAKQMRLYERCGACRGKWKRVPCPECKGTGQVLTPYGRDLKTFIRDAVDERLSEWEAAAEAEAQQQSAATNKKGA